MNLEVAFHFGDTNMNVDQSAQETQKLIVIEEDEAQQSKRIKVNAATNRKSESMFIENRNTPLKDERDPVVIVKAYHTDSFKINTVMEFFGVLGPVDTAYSRPDFDEEEEAMMGGIDEMKAHLPPPSLVPRLHALYFRELGEAHPLQHVLSKTGMICCFMNQI
jgi:hypothetical protein